MCYRLASNCYAVPWFSLAPLSQVLACTTLPVNVMLGFCACYENTNKLITFLAPKEAFFSPETGFLYVALAVLDLTLDPRQVLNLRDPVSAFSQVLELKACTITTRQNTEKLSNVIKTKQPTCMRSRHDFECHIPYVSYNDMADMSPDCIIQVRKVQIEA